MKNLILVGGGHSHTLLVLALMKNPNLFGTRENLNIVLINTSFKTPYSGMMTGAIAGYYGLDDIFINLRDLCEKSNVTFYEDRVVSINGTDKIIQLQSGIQLEFNVLSVDTGSTPRAIGFNGNSLAPVKPIDQFFTKLTRVEEDKKNQLIKLAVVGGGTSGCEITACLASRWKSKNINYQITLFESSDLLIDQYCDSLSNAWLQFLRFNKISVELNKVVSASELKGFDLVVNATAAQVGDWLKLSSDLQFTPDGFLKHNEFLQTNFENIFAAGDVAKNPHFVVARAGVYAVRQAPFLIHNIRCLLGLENKLLPYKPQKSFLSLMTDGQGGAFARRGSHYWGHSPFWFWLKNKIDTKFMASLR